MQALNKRDHQAGIKRSSLQSLSRVNWDFT